MLYTLYTSKKSVGVVTFRAPRTLDTYTLYTLGFFSYSILVTIKGLIILYIYILF